MFATDLRADLIRPPRRALYVWPAEGCEPFIKALERAVTQKQDAVLKCLRPWTTGSIRVKCSFNAAGVTTKCEALSIKISKRENACAEQALRFLRLDPKAGDPRQCSADIEVRSDSPHTRPHRQSNDPDDPLNGL